MDVSGSSYSDDSSSGEEQSKSPLEGIYKFTSTSWDTIDDNFRIVKTGSTRRYRCPAWEIKPAKYRQGKAEGAVLLRKIGEIAKVTGRVLVAADANTRSPEKALAELEDCHWALIRFLYAENEVLRLDNLTGGELEIESIRTRVQLGKSPEENDTWAHEQKIQERTLAALKN